MKITRFQPDGNGKIHMENVGKLLTMGLQNDVVTLWASIGESGGIPMNFIVHEDGDDILPEDEQRYITSFINDHLIVHLFSLPQEQSIFEKNTEG